MGNDEITLTIKYENMLYNLTIKNNLTIREIIVQFIRGFPNAKNNDISNYILSINGIICEQEKQISFYENYIKDKYTFELIYKADIIPECYKKEDSKKNKTNIIEECYVFEPINEKNIIEGNNINKNQINKEIKSFKKREKKFSDMTINIRFFKTNNNKYNNITSNNANLFGLLKLCLLKEIAITKDFDNIKNYLPKNLSNLINIMEILKNGKIDYKNNQEGILKLLQQVDGSNIINFSKYVDNVIHQSDINKYLIQNLYDSKNDIIHIYNCLGKYIEYTKLFQKELERAKKESVFEFSIISATIIEREEVYNFEKFRNNCPNRKDRVLFHGTSYDSIAKILTSMFHKSHCIQHGNGIYFTQELDSCWIYGSEDMNKCVKDNHRNLNIPQIGSSFSFIASAIYYNKNGFKRVINADYTPKTNEINFAYAGMNHLETIKDNVDETKFYGTEFVIDDLNQILPFMSFKLKRDEYCIIWRDTNFSKNPVYNNEFDDKFKQFLKERLEYINQMAKFNTYPCETSEEALNLIKRKKYNKIILISNIGPDKGGKKFVEDARKIIGNDIIVLFSAYSIQHLTWVKDFKNALFSNEPKFYEEYLDCFYGKNISETKKALMNLKTKIENHYDKIKFKFDNNYLLYSLAESQEIKKYSDLKFEI